MSFASAAIALHHSRAKGTTLVILLGITEHDGDGGSWPTIATLMKYGRCTRSQVQRCLAELERLGEIRRDIQAGGDHATAPAERPNRYAFLLRCPADCDGSPQHRTRSSQQRILDLDPEQLPGFEDEEGAAPMRREGAAPMRREGAAPMRPKPIPRTTTELPETNSSARARAKPVDNFRAPVWPDDRCPGNWKAGTHELDTRRRCAHCHEKPAAFINPSTGELA